MFEVFEESYASSYKEEEEYQKGELEEAKLRKITVTKLGRASRSTATATTTTTGIRSIRSTSGGRATARKHYGETSTD